MIDTFVALATVIGTAIALYGLTSHAETHLKDIRDLLREIRDLLRKYEA